MWWWRQGTVFQCALPIGCSLGARSVAGCAMPLVELEPRDVFWVGRRGDGGEVEIPSVVRCVVGLSLRDGTAFGPKVLDGVTGREQPGEHDDENDSV